jgi:hypothetical protein
LEEEFLAGEGGREELEDGGEGGVPVPKEGFGMLNWVVLFAVAAAAANGTAAVFRHPLFPIPIVLLLLFFLSLLTDTEK